MSLSQLPHRRIYWRAWAGIVVTMLVLRCTVFFGPWGDHLGLFTAYALATWPPIMVLFLVERYRLPAYLEQRDPQKWAQLTGAQPDGSYKFPAHRSLTWLSTSVQTGDPVLEEIKLDQQWLAILALCVFLSYLPMFALLLYARAA